jgi:biopolymer transport protein TolQ
MTMQAGVIYLQMAAAAAPAASPHTGWGMVANASFLTQIVLVVLALLSVVSWAVMFGKWRELRATDAAGRSFMRQFVLARSVDEAGRVAAGAKPSPFTRVFDRATQFMTQTTPALPPTAERVGRFSSSQVEALRLVLDSETVEQRDLMTRYVPWLATIGSVSPLIGLLGTVLGVIEAFVGIAREGAGNISAVAPGIAEALIATAAALAVAIPAVFGYNVFATRVNRLDGELEGFGSELIALMVRDGRI